MASIEPSGEVGGDVPILTAEEVVAALLRGTLSTIPGAALLGEFVGLGIMVAGRLDRVRATAQEMAAASGGGGRLLEGLRDSERLEVLALRALEAGSDSYDEAKRLLLGQVVGRAVLDDAVIDEAELHVFALREMDAPHARALEEFRRLEEEASDRRLEEPESREQVSKAISEASRKYPVPVRATLIRIGVVLPATLVGGGVEVYGVSDFGRTLVEELRSVRVQRPPQQWGE